LPVVAIAPKALLIRPSKLDQSRRLQRSPFNDAHKAYLACRGAFEKMCSKTAEARDLRKLHKPGIALRRLVRPTYKFDYIKQDVELDVKFQEVVHSI
jgi:hypothetical protein